MKPTKKLIIVLFLMIESVSYAQEKELHSVKIEYEHFLTESIDFVDCTSFRTAFNNTIFTKVYNDSLSIREFRNLKTRFEKKRNRNLNIRGIISFDYGQIKIQYCFDRYGYFPAESRWVGWARKYSRRGRYWATGSTHSASPPRSDQWKRYLRDMVGRYPG